ncbi:hypothetical protein [Glutamicibacter ardleyensis]|uniref:hypothetical protein n=1 Tax=Glutamicibacter ardleyensis TaxID=225894 RepID=UPI003FD648F6
MSKIIKFKNIDISANGVITCEVIRDESSVFHISLPYSYTPHVDLLASSFCAIAGRGFDRIELDLPVGEGLHKRLEFNSQTNIVCRTGTDNRRRQGSATALNFSGGFDSLAARYLLPNAHLISLDFGGRFSRERDYFEKYNPYIFETNLTSLGLNRHSWQFMSIGSILLRDELDLGHYAFGSIMAGSLSSLLVGPADQSQAGVANANDLGMSMCNPVAGISEVAALSLVASSSPHELLKVLKSVALPKEEKYLRKYQMLNAVAKLHDLPVGLPEPPSLKPRMRWGENFATDLSSMFVAKVLGTDAIGGSYIEGIPLKSVHLIDNISLEFMTRFNPHAYGGIEHEKLSNWYKTLLSAGIHPFERKDWNEASLVVQALAAG